MTRCACTVFARSGKLHGADCAMRKALEQRKAGKRERIAKMTKNLFPKQEPVVDAQLMRLLGMKKETR